MDIVWLTNIKNKIRERKTWANLTNVIKQMQQMQNEKIMGYEYQQLKNMSK